MGHLHKNEVASVEGSCVLRRDRDPTPCSPPDFVVPDRTRSVPPMIALSRNRPIMSMFIRADVYESLSACNCSPGACSATSRAGPPPPCRKEDAVRRALLRGNTRNKPLRDLQHAYDARRVVVRAVVNSVGSSSRERSRRRVRRDDRRAPTTTITRRARRRSSRPKTFRPVRFSCWMFTVARPSIRNWGPIAGRRYRARPALTVLPAGLSSASATASVTLIAATLIPKTTHRNSAQRAAATPSSSARSRQAGPSRRGPAPARFVAKPRVTIEVLTERRGTLG